MSTIQRLLSCLAAAAFAAVLAVSPLLAQAKGPNGGMLVGKDGHETELVVSPTELTLYLIEKGKVESAKGAVVRAVIQEGGKNTTINMAVVEGKKLVAKLAAPLGKGAIVVVTGKDDHGHAVNARYVIN
jgi:maltose-binding protein MalE